MRDFIRFIDLVLGECHFVPFERKSPQSTSDFHAGTLTVTLSPGMILQPEERVHVAALWRPLRVNSRSAASNKPCGCGALQTKSAA